MNQQEILKEALHRAWQGEEYGDLVGKLEPEYQKRLKSQILDYARGDSNQNDLRGCGMARKG